MKCTLFFALIFSFVTSQAQERPISGILGNAAQQNDYVFDLEEVLSRQQEQALEDVLRRFEQATQSRLLVISVADIEDFSDFDQYCFRLLDELEVQQRLGKNGLVLIFSGKLRRINLNTEMERRKIVEDSVYEKVLQEVVIPEFKNKNYYNGLQKAIAALLYSYNN